MGTGRRDFGELGAKLEKHLERLPDYAQRAQEKLQQYFPPEGAPRQRANPLRRPVPPRPSISDVPVFAEARSRWEQWNAPAAKLERRKRRASRALTLWIILTLLCGLFAFATGFGLIGAGGLSEAFGGIAGAIVFGTLGVRSGLRLRQLSRTELPVSTTPPPLPSPNSAAREPMERLAEGEASLAELLRQLAETVVPDISVEDARKTAAEAASALRGLAGRIQAIERARRSAPAGERKALDAAIRTLREQLDDGLDGYGALIAAAGHAVAAGGSGLQQDALTDATDRLAGLAIALRELS
ncbi:phage shock envelope stress response protein PspM [Amycolatopsis alkalitolerans]|uniref:Uncharacterized protein n=1 Tax=Amycolatopsis alkalitolerans TaxID=2547244 RepID=A0A5C4LTZ2_9PSEU|nr:hypothetical protein [Amycolatopsis alkalitolerans]TNC22630.1 hypothetical protein FG385_24610 [Amycolatopsis alkalitolerans]